MYVRRLFVDDLRSFHRAEVEFLSPGSEEGPDGPRLPNVNVLLGINGSGKSTVLDAIALSLLSPLVASSGYRPYALIRRGAKAKVQKASVSVEVQLTHQDVPSLGYQDKDTLKIGASVERRGDIEFLTAGNAADHRLDDLFFDSSPAFFFVGYGAMRRVEAEGSSESSFRGKSRHPRYERVASLFEDEFGLAPFRAWLPHWRDRDPARYENIVRLVSKLLPRGISFAGEMEAGEFLFRSNRTSVPFGALSDGYRAYLGWISDLLLHLATACAGSSDLEKCEGVVMVDEIDLHIHPAWQRTIVPQIARALPRLQFIFTTHSPIVVGTLERANTWIVERRRGRPTVERPDEEFFGLSSDQILRSELFGLSSTRDVSFKRELDALAAKAQAGDSDAAMTFARKAARGQNAVVGDALNGKENEPPAWLRRLAGSRG